MKEEASSARPAPRLLVTALSLILLLTASSIFADRDQTIRIRWKSPVNQPVCLEMSANGRYFGSVDRDGTVRFYDRNGHLLWKQTIEGATNVLIARNGQSLLVYSRLNPVYQHIYFFRKDGRRQWKHKVEGSIWAGEISPNGDHAAVTTGKRYVYVYALNSNRPRYRRWRLDGIGYSVMFTPDSRRVVIGTWQDSGLVSYGLNGGFHWRYKHRTDRQYELQLSGDGTRILGLLPGTQHDPGIELCLWDFGGKQIWKQSIKGFDGRALVSPRSQYVALSLASFLSEEGSGIIERKVVVYGANGNLLWDKGGLFFGPRLVALSPNGSSVIVSDGERSLYNIDKRGKILSKFTLGGTVRKTVSSQDGRTVLLYSGDGWLYLVDLS